MESSVFGRYRLPLTKQSIFKPYIIAAMILLSKYEKPQEIMKKLEERGLPRFFQ